MVITITAIAVIIIILIFLNTPFPEKKKKKKKVICKDALLGDKYASSRGQGFISLVQRFLEVVQLTR